MGERTEVISDARRSRSWEKNESSSLARDIVMIAAGQGDRLGWREGGFRAICDRVTGSYNPKVRPVLRRYLLSQLEVEGLCNCQQAV